MSDWLHSVWQMRIPSVSELESKFFKRNEWLQFGFESVSSHACHLLCQLLLLDICLKKSLIAVQSSVSFSSSIVIQYALRCLAVFKWIQEFSYRKQIARQLCTQYVNGIYNNPVTLKSRLRVTQDHWKRNHWTDHIHDLLLVELFDVEYYCDLEMWVLNDVENGTVR